MKLSAFFCIFFLAVFSTTMAQNTSPQLKIHQSDWDNLTAAGKAAARDEAASESRTIRIVPDTEPLAKPGCCFRFPSCGGCDDLPGTDTQ